MGIRGFLHSLPRGYSVLFVLGVTVLLLANDAWPDSGSADTDLFGLLLSYAVGAAALFTAIDRDHLKRKLPRLVAVLTVIVVSTAAALGAAEEAVRLVYRDVTSSADNRGFFTRRWARSGLVAMNSRGFREREFAAVPDRGVYRIAVVGDSFTFGNGIHAEQRFSNEIQQALGPGFEVLNLGVPGHNTPDHLDLVRRTVLGLHPDFVLLQWFVNDVEGDTVGRPTYAPLLPFAALHDRLEDDSAFYTLLNSWWTRQQIRRHSQQSYPAYLQAAYGDPQGEPARLDIAMTRAVLSTLQAAHVGVGEVLFPDAGYDLGPAYPFEFLHARVLQICDEEHVQSLDLRPAFATVKHRQTLWASPLDAHPGALANSIAAVQILQAFEQGWLTARGSS